MNFMYTVILFSRVQAESERTTGKHFLEDKNALQIMGATSTRNQNFIIL